MVAAGLAHRTIAERLGTMTRFERDTSTPVLAAERQQLTTWIGAPMDDGREVTPGTKSARHYQFSAFFKWAEMVELRTDNPMRRIKAARRPRRHPRPVSNVGFQRMLATARADGDDEMVAMLLLGGFQGYRVHEIAMMHGDHIDYDAATIWVEGKGGVAVELPIHTELLEHAAAMPRGCWFPSQRAAHICRQTASERIRLHMIRCRVKGTPHCLRHFFGTELVERGVDIRVVQELMRHASLSTTALYVAVAQSRRRAALELLSSTPAA